MVPFHSTIYRYGAQSKKTWEVLGRIDKRRGEKIEEVVALRMSLWDADDTARANENVSADVGDDACDVPP